MSGGIVLKGIRHKMVVPILVSTQTVGIFHCEYYIDRSIEKREIPDQYYDSCLNIRTFSISQFQFCLNTVVIILGVGGGGIFGSKQPLFDNASHFLTFEGQTLNQEVLL